MLYLVQPHAIPAQDPTGILQVVGAHNWSDLETHMDLEGLEPDQALHSGIKLNDIWGILANCRKIIVHVSSSSLCLTALLLGSLTE
jgi:hypothetical protein